MNRDVLELLWSGSLSAEEVEAEYDSLIASSELDVAQALVEFDSRGPGSRKYVVSGVISLAFRPSGADRAAAPPIPSYVLAVALVKPGTDWSA